MSVATEVTPAKAVELVEQAVARRGNDYVYPEDWKNPETNRCRYLNEDGTPACIVGDIFAAEGWFWGQAETVIHSEVNYSSMRDLLTLLGKEGELSENVIDVLEAAQSAQDHGDTWGTALTKAERKHEEFLARAENGGWI